MPDRAAELASLAEADRHIAEGRRRIVELQALVDEAEANGEDATRGTRTLNLMIETMVQFEEHRAAIVQTISDIDAGKYGQ